MKHEINLNGKFSTNLIDEIQNKKIEFKDNIFTSRVIQNNQTFSTIYFIDITDETNYMLVKKSLLNELNKYIQKVDSYLIIGVGNPNSNLDSLGPKTLENILVTNHLKAYGLDSKYKLVSKFSPDVQANTGLDSYTLINNILKEEQYDQLIIIDSLITNNIDNITRCIQLSNTGIHLENKHQSYKGSLTYENLKIPVTFIGIPTILETDKLNIVITTKDIDNFIKKSSSLIGECINELIHNHDFTKDVPG